MLFLYSTFIEFSVFNSIRIIPEEEKKASARKKKIKTWRAALE